MQYKVQYLITLILLLHCFSTVNQSSAQQADGSSAANAAMAAFRIPKDFTIKLFAAEPMLTNPIAFCIDDHGRIYVAEDHRFLAGTPENRTHSFMLEDDLQVNTLQDRLAMQKKWAHKFPNNMQWYTSHSDIIRRLVDTNQDGQADTSTVFADGFNQPLDGLGSGLIARDGKIWYTCIPNLWELQDKNNDGIAENKTSLLRGFGVNAAFYGHDLHGLVWGPDGKLYFSVGDRGAHVLTKEGNTIANPRNGAVFRCNPDGTNLELIHKGLRNPQELAFDQYGNLFADDNNCDKGDHSRLVYIVPGGESGWNMSYQTIPAPYLTGPWHAEGIWHLSHVLQPAHIVPPIAKLGAGPSGFTFNSGTSMPPRYRNHFYYCNYTGNGGIESFAVQPDGAGFKIVDHHDFLKPVMASDVDFGYDGKMYIAEYQSNPWDRKTSGGRIYTLAHKTHANTPAVSQTQQYFQHGFKTRPADELTKRLEHDDMRVRLRAQFALADRGDQSAVIFKQIVLHHNNQLARIHAIWGLGQLAVNKTEHLNPILKLAADPDPEIRAQLARILSETPYPPASPKLLSLLQDNNARVKYFATLALGSLKHDSAIEPIINMLRANTTNDRYLTHAAVVALHRINNQDLLQKYATDTNPLVRMAVLLVQRKNNDPGISQFLNDVDLKIVTEAARSINDLPLPEARNKLAELASQYTTSADKNVTPLMRRIINANFQLGKTENINAVIQIATSENLPAVIREEAIAILAIWNQGTKRDRVTGFWAPIAKRDSPELRTAIESSASKLLLSTNGDLQTKVTQLFITHKIETNNETFIQWVTDSSKSVDARLASLRLLTTRKDTQIPQLITQLLTDKSPLIRAEARDILAATNKPQAIKLFDELLSNPKAPVIEQQRAIRTLSNLKSQAANALLSRLSTHLNSNTLNQSLHLDLLEALKSSTETSHKNALKQYNASLDKTSLLSPYLATRFGGNAIRGKQLFESAQCIRCHQIHGKGGTAGPDLSTLTDPSRKITRDYLLESIVNPNAKITPGYGTTIITLKDDTVVVGTLKTENEKMLTLLTPDNKTLEIDVNTVKSKTPPISAMPPLISILTPQDLRDLIQYLATLN